MDGQVIVFFFPRGIVRREISVHGAGQTTAFVQTSLKLLYELHSTWALDGQLYAVKMMNVKKAEKNGLQLDALKREVGRWNQNRHRKRISRFSRDWKTCEKYEKYEKTKNVEKNWFQGQQRLKDKKKPKQVHMLMRLNSPYIIRYVKNLSENDAATSLAASFRDWKYEKKWEKKYASTSLATYYYFTCY